MTALYSVYRSQRFDDLVGQEAAARTLKNALISDRVAHAYLFTGIRGTGKTSTARILSKAVNCLNPTDGEPCNQCASCIAITEGSATDLIEIDAASNRGVDEIRDLREKAKYLPAQLRRKVYIIDEAHQLTPEAFNALLKTLEEPPPHVLFILCTTEAHKLPSTIISRCQRFDFRRIGEADIVVRLKQIAAGEGLVAGEDGLLLIATMAHGSMRDAITMLDQMASAGVASIDADAVRQHLGLVSSPELAALLAAAARGDAAIVLGEVERLAQGGADLRQLANALAEMGRKAVLISLGAADAAELGLDPASGEDLTAAVAAAGRGFAAEAFEAALAASTEMKQTHDPRLLLELLMLRLASGGVADSAPPAAVRAGAATAPAKAASTKPAAAKEVSKRQRGDDAGSAAAGETTEAGAETDAVASAEPGAVGAAAAAADGAAPGSPVSTDPPGDVAAIAAGWAQLLDALKGTGPGVRVRALLREAGPVDLTDDVLTIGFPYAIFSEKAQEPLNRQELETAIHNVYQRSFRLRFETVGAAQLSAAVEAMPAPSTAQPARASSGSPEPDDGAGPGDGPPAQGVGGGEGVVNAAIDILGAKVTDVRPRQRGPAGT